MKILIDVDEFEQSGVLTPALADTLRRHATRDTGSTAINMLLAFGAIAIAAGTLTLMPTAGAAAFFGFGFILLGGLVKRGYAAQWGKLGSIWMVVGALILAGAVGALIDQPFAACLAGAIILGGVSIIAESSLLMALVPLAIASAIGGSTGYWHACYMISVTEPTLTLLLFTVLGIVAWQVAAKLRGAHQRLAVTFARMCVILVNFGFWIGSLWGDTPGKIWHDENALEGFGNYAQEIPSMVFVIGWAVALILAGAWGAKHGRRFMVNTVAVFGAIHFYTQWFEYLGLQALPVILAGVTTIAFALGLWRYNKRVLEVKTKPHP